MIDNQQPSCPSILAPGSADNKKGKKTETVSLADGNPVVRNIQPLGREMLDQLVEGSAEAHLSKLCKQYDSIRNPPGTSVQKPRSRNCTSLDILRRSHKPNRQAHAPDRKSFDQLLQAPQPGDLSLLFQYKEKFLALREAIAKTPSGLHSPGLDKLDNRLEANVHAIDDTANTVLHTQATNLDAQFQSLKARVKDANGGTGKNRVELAEQLTAALDNATVISNKELDHARRQLKGIGKIIARCDAILGDPVLTLVSAETEEDLSESAEGTSQSIPRNALPFRKEVEDYKARAENAQAALAEAIEARSGASAPAINSLPSHKKIKLAADSKLSTLDNDKTKAIAEALGIDCADPEAAKIRIRDLMRTFGRMAFNPQFQYPADIEPADITFARAGWKEIADLIAAGSHIVLTPQEKSRLAEAVKTLHVKFAFTNKNRDAIVLHFGPSEENTRDARQILTSAFGGIGPSYKDANKSRDS